MYLIVLLSVRRPTWRLHRYVEAARQCSTSDPPRLATIGLFSLAGGGAGVPRNLLKDAGGRDVGLRILQEPTGTFERAEPVERVLVPEAACFPALGDQHPAYRVDVTRLCAPGVRHGREQRNGGGHVSHPMLASALERHPAQISDPFAHRAGHEDLAARGHGRHACGEVDRRAEPVALAGDRGAVMHSHAYGREPVTGDHLVRCTEAERDRVGWVAMAHHHRIPDGLDDLAAAGPRDPGELAAEGGGELGGVGVAVRLGQRGVARDVGEYEGSAVVLACGHATTVLGDVWCWSRGGASGLTGSARSPMVASSDIPPRGI